MSQSIPQVIDQAIATVPATAQAQLLEIHAAPTCTAVIPADVAHDLRAKFGGIPVSQLMLDLLPLASAYANAPISSFRVGAVALGATGNLYLGANLEFAGQPLSTCLHAEQSAIANAWISGESRLQSLAVSAAPCGSCRQFLSELENASQLSVIVPDQAPRLLSELLPDAFGPSSISANQPNVAGGLLRRENHQLELILPSENLTRLEALRMANQSYAPYTSSFAGVALRTQSGRIFGGPYAENAAFNPSVSPMQIALSQLLLSGQSPSTIEEAVLVQIDGNPCNQAVNSKSVLATVSAANLQLGWANSDL